MVSALFGPGCLSLFAVLLAIAWWYIRSADYLDLFDYGQSVRNLLHFIFYSTGFSVKTICNIKD